MELDPLGWKDFFVALAGASAALVGLLIVAMSVNIETILKTASIPARAASAIGSLTMAVVACCVGLIPGLMLAQFGAVILIGVVALWVLWGFLLRDVLRDRGPDRPAIPRFGAPLVSPVVFTVGGALLVASLPAGVVWVAAAAIMAVIFGVVFAWVALVEILR